MKRLFSFSIILLTHYLQSQNQGVCAGSTVALTAPMPASLTGQSYSLNPGGFSTPGGSFILSPTVTTTYTLYTTGSNGTSIVTNTVVNTVSVFPQPSIAPTFTQSTCTSTLNGFNLNISWAQSPPVPTYTIAWQIFPPGIVPNVPNCFPTPTLISSNGYINPGPYGAMIISANGCVATLTFVMLPPPAPANFSLQPNTSTYTVTCANPTINLSTNNSALSYSWTGSAFGPVSGPSVALTSLNAGQVIVNAQNAVSGCSSSKTIGIVVNTLIPISVVSPTVQNITCNLNSITTVTMQAISPTTNITQQVVSPGGGTLASNSAIFSYAPSAGTGTYTYNLIDNTNGCVSSKTFSILSNPSFPTFSLISSQNFTLGCGSKSATSFQILNASTTPPGGPVSYTLIPPGSSTITPAGPLSNISTYTISIPGTWMAVVKDNLTNCESKIPFSIIQQTTAPLIDGILNPVGDVLDCNKPSTTLTAISFNPNAAYQWSWPPNVNQPGNSLVVQANFTIPASNTLVANYTLTVIDTNNDCRSNTVVPIYQNVFKPNIMIGASPTAFSCQTPTIVLTNQCSSGIPANSIFPKTLPVSGYYWEGPTPQQPLSLSSIYIALVGGTYTLTGKDLNNGCTNNGTISVQDNRLYPQVQVSQIFTVSCPGGTVTLNPIVAANGSLTFQWYAPSSANVTSLTSPTLITNAPGDYTFVVTDFNSGCATSAIVGVWACTGLNETETENNLLSVYPNPSSGDFIIRLTNNLSENLIIVYNMTGEVIKSQKIKQGENVLSLQNVSKGIYFIKPGAYDSKQKTLIIIKE